MRRKLWGKGCEEVTVGNGMLGGGDEGTVGRGMHGEG